MTPTQTTLASSPDLATPDSWESSADDNIPQPSSSTSAHRFWSLKNALPRTLLPDDLTVMVQERNGHTLQEYGGKDGLARDLNTTLDNGMQDDSLHIQKRREEFGANISPGQSPKGFLSFLSCACNDATFIMFIVWAMHSLASGIKSHGVKEGWYEGVAIAVAAILMILVTAFTEYWQGLQFLKLNKTMEKRNILVEVARGGKKLKIPIFDLVVGDIAFLEIGDQVPADGILVQGDSVCIDESTMTGESDPVHVNCVMPFLLAGGKVIEGSGKMLVTGVGIKTAWGRLLVEHKEEDAREKIPLVLCLNDATAFARQFLWAVAALGFVILLIFNFVGHKGDSNNSGKSKAGYGMVLTIIVVGLVLTQGMRLAITLSLTYAVKRMMVDRAVMGDELNDGSALNEANIGLSMGILDDNFASVVNVVRWGRSIYLNIQKFIQFQLTVNVAALSINVITAVSVGHVPLMAVQLLWVNLIMDTLGALAMATEPPTDEELERPPVQLKEPLISNIMIRNVVVQALYQVVILLTLQFKGRDILGLGGPDATDIIVFNSFVLCQLFNEVNARKLEDWNILKGLSGNRRFVGIIFSTLALQVIVVEFSSKFASTVKLSWQHWLISIVIGFFSWPVALLGKLIPVPKKSLCSARVGPLCSINSEVNDARR